MKTTTLLLLSILCLTRTAPAETLDEIKSDWEKYEATLRNLGYSANVSCRVTAQDGEQMTETHFNYQYTALNHGERLVLTPVRQSPSLKDGRVYARNEQYRFTVTGTPQAGWLFDLLSTPTNPNAQLDGDLKHMLSGKINLVSFGQVSLAELVDSGSVRVTPTGVVVENSVIETGLNTITHHTANLEVDPRAYHVLRRGHAIVKMNRTEGRIRIENEYTIVDGVPVPSHCTYIEEYSTTPRLTIRTESTFRCQLAGSLRQDDFTLTHYNLPEPPGVTWESPTPTYVWLLLAAAVLGIIVLGCRWLLKRRAKAVPPPVPPTPTA
jgi:hypothetical protein